MAEDQKTVVERLLTRDLPQHGQPLSMETSQRQRSLEAYLKAGFRPRWMQRVMEIDSRTVAERRRLDRLYRELERACGADRDEFARRWRALAQQCRYDELNVLIRQHNEWYPIERNLPFDIRTRDYRTLGGRSYRRPELGPEWVLEHFPA